VDLVHRSGELKRMLVQFARRLAARDLASTNKVFTRLLRRKRTFSWEAEGELLLRHHKPGYFDDTMLPTTVTLSPRVAEVVERVGFTR